MTSVSLEVWKTRTTLHVSGIPIVVEPTTLWHTATCFPSVLRRTEGSETKGCLKYVRSTTAFIESWNRGCPEFPTNSVPMMTKVARMSLTGPVLTHPHKLQIFNFLHPVSTISSPAAFNGAAPQLMYTNALPHGFYSSSWSILQTRFACDVPPQWYNFHNRRSYCTLYSTMGIISYRIRWSFTE